MKRIHRYLQPTVPTIKQHTTSIPFCKATGIQNTSSFTTSEANSINARDQRTKPKGLKSLSGFQPAPPIKNTYHCIGNSKASAARLLSPSTQTWRSIFHPISKPIHPLQWTLISRCNHQHQQLPSLSIHHLMHPNPNQRAS
jgi:hypothetical protein